MTVSRSSSDTNSPLVSVSSTQSIVSTGAGGVGTLPPACSSAFPPHCADFHRRWPPRSRDVGSWLTAEVRAVTSMRPPLCLWP